MTTLPGLRYARPMLLTDIDCEARSLVHLAEELGEDPEAAAEQWAEATLAEVRRVIARAHQFGLSRESEWAEDFRSAHKWIRAEHTAAEYPGIASRALTASTLR